MNKKTYRNSDVKSVTMGVPSGHRHIRTVIETVEGEVFVFQEATVSAIVRAYTTIKTHPQKSAVRLDGEELDTKKKGYAGYQLMESDEDSGAICDNLSDIIDKPG
ncbi:MAG: hypothetical protein K8T10_17555 [Candidatus Eremiobacteraeota bacterium]|nr:hypothetical protein [Candidatus Eremiobacteraeota bacterium]